MPAAVLWGAGTALGEIPPYAVAYHASVAGGKVSSVEETLAVSARRQHCKFCCVARHAEKGRCCISHSTAVSLTSCTNPG